MRNVRKRPGLAGGAWFVHLAERLDEVAPRPVIDSFDALVEIDSTTVSEASIRRSGLGGHEALFCSPSTKWVHGAIALPHIDVVWKGYRFLSLMVHGRHVFGSGGMQEEWEVWPGDLFVVDPMRRHWLCPPPDKGVAVSTPFVLLQWEIRVGCWEGEATEVVRRLIDLERRLSGAAPAA